MVTTFDTVAAPNRSVVDDTVCDDELRDMWTCIGSALGCCFLLFLAVLFGMSVHQVPSNKYGIAHHTVTGRVENKLQSEGLYMPGAFSTFILWPKTVATGRRVVTGNSADGVRVECTVTYQYLPREDSIYDLTLKHSTTNEYKKIIRRLADSGVHDAIGTYTSSQFQTERSSVQATIFDNFIKRFDDDLVSTDVFDVQLVNVMRPKEYEAAVDDRESARNDITTAQNEEAQALTQANTALLTAKAEANQTIAIANIDATTTLAQATNDATVITTRYDQLGETYAAAKKTLDLNTDEDLIAYARTRALENLDGVKYLATQGEKAL